MRKFREIEMDLVSVIVPVYNVEPYLKRCVDSIRRQTYENLEIILVDDGSPDRCGQMCDEFAQEDERIKVIHKENGGLGYARNSGLEVTTGEYVTFIDSDDWISDTHIENLYKEAKAYGADLVIGGHTSVNIEGQQQECQATLSQTCYKEKKIIQEILLPLIGADPNYPNDIQVNSSSCMNLYAVAVIRKYDLKFVSERIVVAEDLFFNIDYLYHARCVKVSDEAGYYYYQNDESISRMYQRERFRRTVNYYYALKEKAAVYDFEEEAKYRVGRNYLMKIRVAIKHIVCAEMPRKKKLQEIREILDHEVTRKVLADYPIHTFIPAMRLLATMMKKQNVLGVYCLMQLREGIGRQGIAKKVLQMIGIGR